MEPTRHSGLPEAIGTPKLLRPLEQFLHIEASSGIILLAAVIAALVWANWPGSDSYDHVWHTSLGVQLGALSFSQPLHFFINDGLMTIFFFVVGLEIRREMHAGALASFKLAALPLAAAIGGVAVPAVIYTLLNADPLLRMGWAIPTATDIAFAVGLLALLGNRVSPQLRILLLALAIIDDIGAILIIAFFYSSGVQIAGVAIAAAGVLLVLVFHFIGVRTAWLYILPGAVVWVGVLNAGIHPTIAGVILGLLTPVTTPVDRKTLLDGAAALFAKVRDRLSSTDRNARTDVSALQQLAMLQRELLPPVVRLEAALHPWVAFAIMPLFALANAGVTIDRDSLGALLDSTMNAGIVLGLVFGKPIGIVFLSAAAVRIGLASLSAGVNYQGLIVIGCLAGIGFTMSIFIAQLAFTDPQLLSTAKLAVLIASTVAALVGLALGAKLLRARDDRAPVRSQ